MGDAVARDSGKHPYHIARKILGIRQVVREGLPPYLTHDPAPDILLFLFMADCDKRHLSRDDIMEKTGLNRSAVTRWLAALTHQRLVKETGYLVGLTKEGVDRVNAIIAGVTFLAQTGGSNLSAPEQIASESLSERVVGTLR